LGIGLSMGMMEFGLVMLTANAAFIPSSVFRGLWHSYPLPVPHTLKS